jgi:hypothetical protein
MTSRYSEHYREIADRMNSAETDFVACLMQFGECSQSDAEKVMALYFKHKLVKRDTWNAKISVKHGGYLEHDAIRRAIEMA